MSEFERIQSKIGVGRQASNGIWVGCTIIGRNRVCVEESSGQKVGRIEYVWRGTVELDPRGQIVNFYHGNFEIRRKEPVKDARHWDLKWSPTQAAEKKIKEAVKEVVEAIYKELPGYFLAAGRIEMANAMICLFYNMECENEKIRALQRKIDEQRERKQQLNNEINNLAAQVDSTRNEVKHALLSMAGAKEEAHDGSDAALWN